MRGLKASILMLLLMLYGLLCADLVSGNSRDYSYSGDFQQEYSHTTYKIDFGNLKTPSLFLVEYWMHDRDEYSKADNISFADKDLRSISFTDPEGKYYLLWDPNLRDPYTWKSEAYRRNVLSYDNIRDNPMAVELVCLWPYGFKQITRYCTYTLDSEGRGRLTLHRTDYECPYFMVREYGSSNSFMGGLAQILNNEVDSYATRMSERNALKVYRLASELPNHEVTGNIPSWIRQPETPSEPNEDNPQTGYTYQQNQQHPTSPVPPLNILPPDLPPPSQPQARILNPDWSKEFTLALVLSWLMEFLTVLLAYRLIKKAAITTGMIVRIFILVVLSTGFTLTVNWWLIIPVTGLVAEVLLLMESLAIAVEALTYRTFLPVKWSEALFISLLANMVSYAAGVVLFKYLHLSLH